MTASRMNHKESYEVFIMQILHPKPNIRKRMLLSGDKAVRIAEAEG